MKFDRFAMVDWSGGNDRGAKPKKDAIWACVADQSDIHEPVYLRNRQMAECWLSELIENALLTGQRLCVGFDFPFGYPLGFAKVLTGENNPLILWDWFADRVVDCPNENNRFDLAGHINNRFGGRGPFWMNGLKRDIAGLPRNKSDYVNPFPDRRRIEELTKGTFTCWQMAGAGSVGSQVMMGLPVLSRLRHQFEGQVAIWPFEPLNRPIAFVEIWPSLTVDATPIGWIKDAWQVHRVALNLSRQSPKGLARQLTVHAPEEGWILGVPCDKAKVAA